MWVVIYPSVIIIYCDMALLFICMFTAIWTANGNNEEAALEIGHKLREALRLGRQNLLQYQLHKDTMVKQGSSVKSIYTL